MSDATTDARDLVALIDRLEALLNDSDLSEIEVEAGATAVVLRKPVALAGDSGPGVGVGVPVASHGAPAVAGERGAESAASSESDAAVARANAVVAPLTGLFYSSPSPGAEPYVKVGSQVMAGQVIGLIEAMKLFNEIKSDKTGRVVRICADDGALVKAKQPLIEVEP